jgi:hypothetical protein
MADKPWKVHEREVAKALGGTRTGPLGKDMPDCIDAPLVAPECKLYEKFIFLESDMEQARHNAKNIPGDKIPLVVLKERKRGGRKAVRMDWDGFLRLYRLAVIGEGCEVNHRDR